MQANSWRRFAARSLVRLVGGSIPPSSKQPLFECTENVLDQVIGLGQLVVADAQRKACSIASNSPTGVGRQFPGPIEGKGGLVSSNFQKAIVRFVDMAGRKVLLCGSKS